MTDTELAAHLAGTAGQILLDIRNSGVLAGKDLGAEGDAVANRYLVDALRKARPDDALLSEEEKDSLSRLGVPRCWIVDPLDGTREYGEGRSDWAVHVALSVDGNAAIGAVALPGLGVVMRSDQARPLPPVSGRLRMVVSRSRPAQEAVAVAKALDAELIPMGSAGAKAMAVVRGGAEIYLHSGGQYEWDSCAPVAVAQGHGLHCSRIDGSPLLYNQSDSYMPDLLICRVELAAQLIGMARVL